AVEAAVIEGRRAADALRQRVDAAIREIRAAAARLASLQEREGSGSMTPSRGVIIVTCSACGAQNNVPLERAHNKAICGACRRRLQSEHTRGAAVADATVRQFADLLEEHAKVVGDLFQRQERALASFNLVFFGRTGAGKSSLLEALSRGDGSAVSQG